MVQMLVHHKWFIRAALAMFWAAEVIANAYGHGFLTSIVLNQPLIMFAIVFVSIKYLVEPFYAPFLKLTTVGGETMEKSTSVMLGVILLAITFSILMIWDVSRTFIIQTLFIDTIFSNGYLAILAFETWLITFSPLWVILVTGIATLLFAVLLNTFVRPRIPFHRTPSQPASPTPPYSAPTPPGATTRPEPPVQKVEIAIKTEPQPLVKTKPQPIETTKKETATT